MCFCSFSYPTAFKGCVGIGFTFDGWVDKWQLAKECLGCISETVILKMLIPGMDIDWGWCRWAMS